LDYRDHPEGRRSERRGDDKLHCSEVLLLATRPGLLGPPEHPLTIFQRGIRVSRILPDPLIGRSELCLLACAREKRHEIPPAVALTCKQCKWQWSMIVTLTGQYFTLSLQHNGTFQTYCNWADRPAQLCRAVPFTHKSLLSCNEAPVPTDQLHLLQSCCYRETV